MTLSECAEVSDSSALRPLILPTLRSQLQVQPPLQVPQLRWCGRCCWCSCCCCWCCSRCCRLERCCPSVVAVGDASALRGYASTLRRFGLGLLWAHHLLLVQQLVDGAAGDFVGMNFSDCASSEVSNFAATSVGDSFGAEA